MERTLQAFLHDRDAGLLKEFERQRCGAVADQGISAFWTAVLNIRLNGVPLLDPLAGVSRSIEEIRMTREQIAHAITP